jgi:hypothetical protein
LAAASACFPPIKAIALTPSGTILATVIGLSEGWLVSLTGLAGGPIGFAGDLVVLEPAALLLSGFEPVSAALRPCVSTFGPARPIGVAALFALVPSPGPIGRAAVGG